MLGHRELIIGVTALVAGVRAYQAGETVRGDGRVRRAPARRHGDPQDPSRRSARRAGSGAGPGRCRPRNFWLFLALAGRGGLPGTFYVWRAYAPDAAGVHRRGVLGRPGRRRRPRRLPSPAHLPRGQRAGRARLGLPRRPARRHRHARRGTRSRSVFRSPASGRSSPAGRSALVNNHWTLAVQRDAIDFVQGRRREDLPRRPEPPGELPHLRAAAARRRGRPGHGGRGRPPGPARRRDHLARHGGQPRGPRHRRRALRPLRAPEAGQPARPGRRRRSGAVR